MNWQFSSHDLGRLVRVSSRLTTYWWKPLALQCSGLGLLVLIWWAATTLVAAPGSFANRFAPGPTLLALQELVQSGTLWSHLLASAQRVALGCLLSAGIGIPLGLTLGSVRWITQVLGPVMQFLRMVSPLTWMPLALLLFGAGSRSVIFLLVLAAVWPILLSTANGVMQLDPRWLAVGQSLGANRWELVQHIVWPGIRSHLTAGLQLAVGITWIVLVPAEMLGVDSGLGYAVLNARDRLAYGELMALLLVIGICGIVLDGLTRWLLGVPSLARRRRWRVRWTFGAEN